MKIVIASGKGGTGKTTVAVNLATYLNQSLDQKINILDCDVEAPNADLFLGQKKNESISSNSLRPVVDLEKCISCGKCVSACEFNAIAKVKNNILVFPELCHSCGACEYFCDNNSITLIDQEVGRIDKFKINSSFDLYKGELSVGEVVAPQVIDKLKEFIGKDAINILDAPPGTTCSVVRTLTDTDYCILVTEPTPFGLNDLKLALELTAKMNLRVGVIINKSSDSDYIIEDYLSDVNVCLLGKIPYKLEYAKSYSKGELLIEKFSDLKKRYEDIWESISKLKHVSIDNFKKEDTLERSLESQNQLSLKKILNEVVVISGKGGTGKTTVTAALGQLINNKILADNDVDASNLHLLRELEILNKSQYVSGKICAINYSECISCGKCMELCQFSAIDLCENSYYIKDIACEGCMLCKKVCPAGAISQLEDETGELYISKDDDLCISHAMLYVGAENSGKLVTKVRDNARSLAINYNESLILSDGPPGIGCPVISSITGTDCVIIVTEASVSGLKDLTKTLLLLKHFNLKGLIIINKFDLNEDITHDIEDMSNNFSTKVVGKIPHDKEAMTALIEGNDLVTHGKGSAYKAILKIWDNLKKEIPYIDN